MLVVHGNHDMAVWPGMSTGKIHLFNLDKQLHLQPSEKVTNATADVLTLDQQHMT